MDHLEVFNKRKTISQVLNLDGTINWPKTRQAIKQGRTLK